MAGTILIGLDRVELGYFVDLILSTSDSDDVRIEEIHIVLQYRRGIPLWVDADKEHLNLLLFCWGETFVDIRDVSESRRADIRTMGETKTEQDQFATKIPKGEWLTVLVGKSKVRGGLSRHEFDCIKGRGVSRPTGTSQTGKDESYEGKASK